MIKWRTEKVRPTYVPTFCVGLDGMCRVLLGRCCRLIEDAVSTIYRAFIFRSAVDPTPPTRPVVYPCCVVYLSFEHHYLFSYDYWRKTATTIHISYIKLR